MDYLYDEAGRLFAGAYASGAASVPFQVVTTDRGDVRELRDADGAAFAFYGYDAYGDPTCALSKATTAVTSAVAAAIASRQPLRYASYADDAHSGLYYCSQRYYDPEVGASVSKDPARADGEESAHQYCGGDPVGKVDPSGLWQDSEHRRWTHSIVKEYGWCEAFADAAGQGSWDVDHGYLSTSSAVYFWTDSVWRHFNKDDHDESWENAHYGPGATDSRVRWANILWTGSAVPMWYGGNHKTAFYILGLALHALQDTWAHGDTTRSSHLVAPRCPACNMKRPDCGHFKPERVDRARAMTRAWVKKMGDL